MGEGRMSRVLLAVVGDANDPATFSGTAFHCLEAGRALGVIDAGLPLGTRTSAWRRRRVAWNVARLLTHLEKGGYQYSETFLERLWRPVRLLPGDILVNMFQLYPSRLFARHLGPRWFFIDQTLNQMFTDYGIGEMVGPRIAQDALAREREQYRAAEGVVAQSEWAARDLRETYGIRAGMVHVAVPGANLNRDGLAAWEADQASVPNRAGRPLRLCFVGKDWRRKGLDRLLRALAGARAAGAEVEAVVIGVERATLPPDLARMAGVEWAGFIDKRRDLFRFLDTVAACDVGCLLSRAEAGGMALREFCRLGLPTLAPAVGGAPEYVHRPAAELVPPDAPDDAIAAILRRLAGDRGELERRRRLAREARHLASWDAAVNTLGRLLGRHESAPIPCPA